MKLKEKIRNMNPKKGFLIWLLCVVIFYVLAGIGTAVNFGSRIPEIKSQMETIEKSKDSSEKIKEGKKTEQTENEEYVKKEKDREHDHEFDIKQVLHFTTGDYVVLGIIAIATFVLFAFYWIYTTAYAVSKAWQFGVNAYLFGILTLFTNLFGIACLWIYIRWHSICPKCGKLLPRKANNCSACGTAIYIKCPDCDTRVSVKDAYCSGCGKKMIH